MFGVRKGLDPATKKGAEILGDGKGFTRLGLSSLELNGADDLQGEQRVPLGDFVHTKEKRTGDLPLRGSPNEGGERSHGQRPHSHSTRADIEGAFHTQWVREPRRFSQRRHDPDLLRVETAQREGQGLGGGTVDPLHIVDRNDDRLGSGHGLERS